MIAERWQQRRKSRLVGLAGVVSGLILVAVPSISSAQLLFSGPSTFSPGANVSQPSPLVATSGPMLASESSYGVSSDRTWNARRALDEYNRLSQYGSAATRELASDNAGWVRQWIELDEKQQTLAQRVNEAQWQLRDAQADFESTQDKLERFGLNRTIGMLLQHKREQLEQWQIAGCEFSFGSHELEEAHQKQLLLELLHTERLQPRLQAVEWLTDRGVDPDSAEARGRVPELERLFAQQNEWIEALRSGYAEFQDQVNQLDSARSGLVDVTKRYRAMIHQQIMWMPSLMPLGFADSRNLRRGWSTLFDPHRSAGFTLAVQHKLTYQPGSAIGLVAATVVLTLLRWRAKRMLMGMATGRFWGNSSRSARKAAAGVLTIVVAVCWPAIAMATAWWLGSGIVSEATLHGSAAMAAGSLAALAWEVIRQPCRELGFLHAHVAVELPGRQSFYRLSTFAGLLLVIGTYAVTLLGVIDRGVWQSSVSRIGYVVLLLVGIYGIHRGLSPTSGVFLPLLKASTGAVGYRMRWLLYAFCGLAVIAFAGLSLIGYHHTSIELLRRVLWTATVVIAVMLAWPATQFIASSLWRFLAGNGGEEAVERDGEHTEVSGALGNHYLEVKHQLAFIGQCGLLLSGLFVLAWFWQDILPQTGLGSLVLWNAGSEAEKQPITVIHLAYAGAVLLVAFQLAKLLPAIFDVLVLQRVSFDEGIEHLVLVTTRALLFGIGCFLSARIVGLRWETMQWLALGLAVGVGFGLHDLLRNLIGGLIVIFEKPTRLGDLVSIGGIQGRVTAHRLRTTVLADDEGREILVPNQNFVSHEIVNHRAAGRVTALSIEVAVSRGVRSSDICRRLFELVREQPRILVAPPPQASLICVGQRSQRIEVRAWVEGQSNAESTRAKLLEIILRDLREKEWLVQRQPNQTTVTPPTFKHQQPTQFNPQPTTGDDACDNDFIADDALMIDEDLFSDDDLFDDDNFRGYRSA